MPLAESPRAGISLAMAIWRTNASNPPALDNSLSRSHSSASHPLQSSRRRRQNVSLGEHYNQAIRPHAWRSKRRVWSKAQIAREREEFFETRVTGRPEVWAALKLAISLMRAGDIPTAQSIIDAAGVTVPTGDLCDGCYDENGALYRLPQVIVADPTNVVDAAAEDQEIRRGAEADDEITNGKLGMDIDTEDEFEEQIENKREEKGKRNERDVIKVCARLSDRGGPDFTVEIDKHHSVSVLVRKLESEAALSSKHRLRIAYLGKILKENETLLAQGWKEGHVVNGLVLYRSP
ncbi:predicted protein [Uncinocarpus reesii 1704]|uniref:Ubiquitin-like domain-containing protein n=1 Tax=Uncinocarpus reesii (strain UAMH 1704) TaxID=336963 RepID=C4JTX1_UNCRE|nr:uncharacterized protein UREG_05910 [Uncinocarpus reesii 1704]EEP81068.1 predicted protein [Uncinocarpus reesii 1704]